MKKTFLTLLLLCATTLNVWADLQNGTSAPDFTLIDTTGQKQTLSSYKNKFVVLEWINPDCPFVKKHYDNGDMQRLQKTYTAKDVVWISINSSAPGKQGSYSPEEFNNWIQKSGVNSTALVLDSDGTVGKSYGAKTTPHMFIINPQGILIYQGAIDSIASADSADVAKANNYVQMALDEALAGKPVTTAATKSYGCSVKY